MSENDPLLLGSWSSLGTDIAFASERGTNQTYRQRETAKGLKSALS
jgi:hypothetical protein